MEVSQVQGIIAWVSIMGTTLVTVFGGAAFLRREMRRGFDRLDARFDGLGRKLDCLVEQLGVIKISLTRIESHLRSNPPLPAGQQRS